MMSRVTDTTRLLPGLALLLVLALNGVAHAGKISLQNLVAERQVAESLEQDIRGSDKLSFFDKLEIKDRYDRVKHAMTSFKRGDLPEEDLRKIFNGTMHWLDGLFAETDPRLHVKLAQARPALWQIASTK